MDLLTHEKKLYSQGCKYIAGVDEVGRGPIAGPFVAAAVILDLEKIFDLIGQGSDFWQNSTYSMINDSKKLTERRRNMANEFILHEVISYSIISLDSIELDSIGVSEATQKLFSQAIGNLNQTPDHVITDAFKLKTLETHRQTNLISGDSISITVAAASIIAKVYRDRLMVELNNKYPQYGFDRHKGYGTREHLEAVKKFGVCPEHRRSYEPIKNFINSGKI